jgi:predicted nucleic acid-binding Zn ribbon protein
MEDPLKICPVCKGRLKRLIGTGAGLIFKGSGFYITDYKKKETSVSGPVKKKKSTDAPSSSEKEKSPKTDTSSKKSDSSKDSK